MSIVKKVTQKAKKVLRKVKRELKKKKLYPVAEKFHFSVEERNALIPEYNELLEQLSAQIGKKMSDDFYYEQGIMPNTVLLLGLGQSVRGNMQAILNELNQSPRFEGFHVYVRTSKESDPIVQGYIEQNNWTRTETVSDGKWYQELMETCQFLLTEVYFPGDWVKKPGQIAINIWHGTPLKKLGLAKKIPNTQKNGPQQRSFVNSDYLLYPNDYTRRNMLKSYKIQPLLTAKALMLGYPRTGGMMAAAQSDQTELRRLLAPNGEQLFAYMPTFKDYRKEELVVAECKELLNYLDENLRHDQILYVNLHHRVSDSIDYTPFRHIKKFPPLVDSYTLLSVTDALVTDFSSVFYDYLALGKQIVLHVEDYPTYKKKRGTYMNLMDLPFDKAYSKEEVLTALNRGKTYDDAEARQTFCTYDTPENAKKLCQLFLGDETGLICEEIPSGKTKTKVLLYSYNCAPGSATDLLNQYIKSYNKKAQLLYVSCEREATAEHKKTAFPMLFQVPVFGAEEHIFLSAVGAAVREQYLAEQISFDQMIRLLKYDYALEFRHMYGEAKFDRLMIYDVAIPEIILALACSDVPEKLLFLQNTMLEQAKEDRFLADALNYASKRCNAVFVMEKDKLPEAAALVDPCWAKKIQVAETAADINLIP